MSGTVAESNLAVAAFLAPTLFLSLFIEELSLHDEKYKGLNWSIGWFYGCCLPVECDGTPPLSAPNSAELELPWDLDTNLILPRKLYV